MSSGLDLTLVPPLGEPRPQPVPTAAESTLPNGLRVVVVPRPGVPLIELRLRVPFATTTAADAGLHTARGSVLSGAILLGSAEHDQNAIAELLQGHGAELSVSTDPDRLLFATTLLPDGLAPVLGVLAELLTGATYPDDRVEGERDRVAERIRIALSQPGVIARSALAARRYGDHPYAITLPEPELVTAVDGDALRDLHRARVLPAGSSLVLVGDLDPRAAADAVAGALGDWAGTGHAVEAPPAHDLRAAGIGLVDRPGAVQSNIRLGGPAPGRTDPDLAAVRLANMIYGGYFSSRLVENIRERRGYTTARAAPSTTRRPARRSSSRPTSPPTSPGRRCWRPGTSWAAWHCCRSPTPSSTPPAATSWAAWRSRPPPTPAWPARSRPWSVPACSPAGWQSTSRPWRGSPSTRCGRPRPATWRRPG
jgi:zinc protease